MIRENNDIIPIITELNIEETPPCSIKKYWLRLITDGLGNPVCIPVIVARGKQLEPVVGITAAVHGNELNGIPVIQRLFNDMSKEDLDNLRGTVVGIPVVNVPSFIHRKRRFVDGVDLNHIMPGKADGNISMVYAHRFVSKVIGNFNYLLDLHTASNGRVNSYYVRADLSEPMTAKLAELQNAQIVVNNPPSDGTLRGAADELGIPAITLEVGNPNTFQKKLIRSGVDGIHNVLSYLNMIDEPQTESMYATIICEGSNWIYTDRGGLLTIHVDLMDILEEGQHIATIRNVFGDKIKEYFAPRKGVVIGKSISPVNQSGGRILHLGHLD